MIVEWDRQLILLIDTSRLSALHQEKMFSGLWWLLKIFHLLLVCYWTCPWYPWDSCHPYFWATWTMVLTRRTSQASFGLDIHQWRTTTRRCWPSPCLSSPRDLYFQSHNLLAFEARNCKWERYGSSKAVPWTPCGMRCWRCHQRGNI